MKTLGSNRPLILAQAGFKRDFQTIIRQALDQARAALTRYALTDGSIPEARQQDARDQVGQIVSDVFTGPDNRRAYAADGVTPISPYARILNKWMGYAVYEAVLQHERWLKAHAPADVFDRLRAGRRPIIEELYAAAQVNLLVAELEPSDVFEPNPLAQIDPSRRWVPPHRWTDENGYRLSDRLWRTDNYTRQQIDALLAEGLRQGRGALDLSRALEAYLFPNEAGVRTLKPYGRRFGPDGAAYSAMRLGRTEIARAFNQASYTAGQMNPYTGGMDVARSGNGDPSCPICPQHATIDMSGVRVRRPYPKDRAPVPPFHPHDMCHVRWVVADDPATVTAQLRAELAAAQQELNISPADARLFTRQLLGDRFGEPWFDRPSGSGAAIGMATRPPVMGLRTMNGIIPRDVGRPGDTLESLSRFLQQSDGPLARALRELTNVDRWFPPLGIDFDTGAYFIDKQNLRDVAKAFVVEARSREYTRDYLVAAMQSVARGNGVNLTNAQAISVYNSEYRYQAQALLELSRIGSVRLTEAQVRWLTDSANGRYYELTSAAERAAQAAARNRVSGGQFATEAARNEHRRNFLRMVNDIDF